MATWDTDEIVPGNVIRAADMIAAMNDAQGDIKLNGNSLLDVASVEVSEIEEPDAPVSGKVCVYVDSTSHELSLKNHAGDVINLESNPVTSVHGRTGAVVAVEGDYSLDKLSDVSLATPSTNDVLMFGGGVWGAGNVAVTVFGRSGTVTATEGDYDLNLMGDVVLTSVHDNDVLTYDSGTSKWINAALGNSSLLDTGTSSGTVALGNDARFVTGGNSHDHNGGDGAQISHLNLSNIGTNSHATIDTHLASTSNPHSVTATQVGLGSVPNYPVATQSEAEAGTATNKLMTPERVAQAINILVPHISGISEIPGVDVDPGSIRDGDVFTYSEDEGRWVNRALPSGIGTGDLLSTNNLSELTSASTARTNLGIGSVDNYATASQSQAEAGTATDKFMTPQRTAQAVAAIATGTGLGAVVATSVAFGSTPSGSGTVKMSNAGAITMRNFGNTADMGILGATSADILRVGYSNLSSIQLGKPTACLGVLSSTVINTDVGISHEATTTNQMGFKIVRTDGTFGVSTYLYAPASSTDFRIKHGGGDRITVTSAGRVLVGTTTDDGANALQVNGQIRTITKTPSSATDTGVAGTMCWDTSFVYVCTATNTWKRSAIVTW